jgi:phage antirepressor YoqD-like protein
VGATEEDRQTDEKGEEMKNKRYEVGDLVVKTTSMETSLGIIRKIDKSVTTPYFVEWMSGFMRGYTSAHSLDHIKQWTKTDRFGA